MTAKKASANDPGPTTNPEPVPAFTVFEGLGLAGVTVPMIAEFCAVSPQMVNQWRPGQQRAPLGRVVFLTLLRFIGEDTPSAADIVILFLKEAVGGALFGLLGEQDWIAPQFQITNRTRRYLASFTALPLMKLMMWGKRNAPSEMREVYYDVGPIFFWELTKSIGREGWRNLDQFARVVMNAHFTRGRA